MGPIPKRSFVIEPQPLKPTDHLVHEVSWLVRKLPPVFVRFLLAADLFLCFLPFWAWWAYRRWAGVWPSAREARVRYTRGLRFSFQHIAHASEGTGAMSVNWFSQPVRHASAKERPDYTKSSDGGSCGTCTNCCTTHWLPEESRLSCPLLGEDGCKIYGGVYWDYFNCGRYPAEPVQVLSYECPRFVRPTPDRLPDDFPVPAREQPVSVG